MILVINIVIIRDLLIALGYKEIKVKHIWDLCIVERMPMMLVMMDPKHVIIRFTPVSQYFPVSPSVHLHV